MPRKPLRPRAVPVAVLCPQCGRDLGAWYLCPLTGNVYPDRRPRRRPAPQRNGVGGWLLACPRVRCGFQRRVSGAKLHAAVVKATDAGRAELLLGFDV